ncbi:MAG TPA: CpaD family pilus assembly lipoprotein [Stellaceae bacterium]|nr:CpaD family pilus assembly lipoprotein [Stellaceae bacterium]
MERRLIVPLAFALALAGCATQPTPANIPMSDGAKSLHVERVRVQLATAFAPGRSNLSVAEAQRLETFLDQAGLRPDDKAYIAVPASDPLEASRVRKLSALLAQRGIGIEKVAPPPSGVSPNHVLLMVDRYVVTAPSCPDWSDSPATPHTNMPDSNFGCATQSNLALMVANPRDLVVGRKLAPADADHAAIAIERYQADRVKGFVGSSASGPSGGQGSAAGGSPMGGTSTSGGGGPSGQ